MIPAKNYKRRRAELARLAKQPLIVLTGSDLVQKSSDETYEFEQDGYFYYLTGITEPGWVLVMDVAKGKEFLISTNESSYHSDVWDDISSDEEIAKQSGCDTVIGRREGWSYLRYNCDAYQSVGSIVPKMRFSRPFGMYINPAKTMLVERLRRNFHDGNLVDISVHIRSLRSVKDEHEIALIRKAADTTKLGFDRIYRNLSNYTTEYDIYADVTSFFMENGTKHGYKPIVAAGKNAAQIHYKSYRGHIRKDDLVLLDIGAAEGRYMADVTRTVEIGNPSQRKKDFITEVKAAYTESLQFLGPGVSMRDHEMHIEQVIGRALNKLGVISSMLRKNIREHYPHAISHHLGIDVHDSCDYEAPLRPGAVITVEPGMYSREEGIGVRHENDILITETGVEVLTEGIA